MKVGAVTPKPHTSYTPGKSVGRQGDSAWLQKNKISFNDSIGYQNWQILHILCFIHYVKYPYLSNTIKLSSVVENSYLVVQIANLSKAPFLTENQINKMGVVTGY